MNLSKREFFQVLGAGTMAGMGLGTYADAEAATATNGLYDIARFGAEFPRFSPRQPISARVLHRPTP